MSRNPINWSGGYTDWRYGDSRPVYRPGNRKSERLSGKQKSEIVLRVEGMLDDWDTCRWQREAEVTHGLRRGLIDKTSDFQYSERTAEEIVDRAFSMLGRGKETRPSYDIGQREYTHPIEYCINCFGPLEAEQIDAALNMCSAECARRKRNIHRANQDLMQQPWARAAYEIIIKDGHEPRDCGHCNKPFRPIDRNSTQVFCSNKCKYLSQKTPPKACAYCHEMFSPTKGLAAQKYCSHEHAMLDKRRTPPRLCAGPKCEQMFIPKHNNESEGGDRGLCCSKKCASELRRMPKHPTNCIWCNTQFLGKNKAAKYCSNAHYQAHRKAIKGKFPKVLNRAVFDFCFSSTTR